MHANLWYSEMTLTAVIDIESLYLIGTAEAVCTYV